MDGRALQAPVACPFHHIGRTYALIEVADRVMPTSTHVRSRVIGVPLNEVVLSTEAASLLLTRRGEEYFLANEGRL